MFLYQYLLEKEGGEMKTQTRQIVLSKVITGFLARESRTWVPNLGISAPPPMSKLSRKWTPTEKYGST